MLTALAACVQLHHKSSLLTAVKNQTSELAGLSASVAAAGTALWCQCYSASSLGRSRHWDECTVSQWSLLLHGCTMKSWARNINQTHFSWATSKHKFNVRMAMLTTWSTGITCLAHCNAQVMFSSDRQISN